MFDVHDRIDPHTLEPHPVSNRNSISFVSLHKTATSYFSSTVLKQVKGMVNIDYQNLHYKSGYKYASIVKPEGYIYGVLRLYDDDHPGKKLTDSVIKKCLLNKLDFVILIRDPRDIIVSMYYSFGFSHGLSPDETTQRYQEKRRESIQAMNIDEYAVYVLPKLKKKLNCLIEMSGKTSRLTILKYDEMIIDFKSFYRKLQQAISIDSNFESSMYANTRPQPLEIVGSHRRSGNVGEYINKLRGDTIDIINSEITGQLKYFDYD